MMITMKFRDEKNIGKKEIHEKIALQIHRKLNALQLKGLIGENHPITASEIQFWIEDYCINKNFLNIVDKIKRDYMLFMERLYETIMVSYIRKDELTKETDDKYNSNEYYYPGLVYITGKGYIIVNSDELVKKYEEQRTDNLEGQKKHLAQKCNDATDFIKLLPENQKELLNEHKEIQ